MPRRPGPDRDELPDRDEVERVLGERDAELAERGDGPLEEPTAMLVEVRPPMRELLYRWLVTLGIVGLVMGALYFLGTGIGRAALEERGALAVMGGWLVFLALVLAGGLATLGIVRAVSGGQRRLRRRELVPVVLGESVLAGAGATAAALLGSIGWADVMRVLSFTFALVAIFTWAVLMPATIARFQEHAEV